MGFASAVNAISSDVLRIEITGPSHPQLTIVDLPGLIHSDNSTQTAQDVELVSKLVRSCMSSVGNSEAVYNTDPVIQYRLYLIQYK